MKSKLLPVLASLLLMTLGVMLYYSATPYMNIYLVPVIKSLGIEPTKLTLIGILALVAFAGALIAGFFSVFLFEMVSGGYRPLLMGLIFATPVTAIHLFMIARVYLDGLQVPVDVIWLNLGEMITIYLSYLLTAWAGRGVARRFFATEAPS
ncbi:hypothetical protein [Thiolapillus sp.]